MILDLFYTIDYTLIKTMSGFQIKKFVDFDYLVQTYGQRQLRKRHFLGAHQRIQ